MRKAMFAPSPWLPIRTDSGSQRWNCALIPSPATSSSTATLNREALQVFALVDGEYVERASEDQEGRQSVD